MSARAPEQITAAAAYPAEWNFVVEVLSGIYTPRQAPDIRQWVHECDIKIPSQHNRTFARLGESFNFDRFPCISSWIFDFVKNPRSKVLFADGTERELENRTSAIMKDSQSTASTCALMCLAWLLTFQPGNVIMIIDNRQQARDFAKDRLDNVLDQFAELKGEELPQKSTALAKRYAGGTLYLGGGQSSSELVSKPAAMCIADEVAKHDLVNEMPTLKLLEGRGTGDDDFRLLAFSTPDNALEHQRNEVTGKMEPVITKETILHSSYLQGTQERCEVPCPHCGAWQELTFERLRFDHCKESMPDPSGTLGKPVWNLERVKRETWYQCANPDCTDRREDGTVRGRIEEHHKPAMMARHRWVATNPYYKPGHRTMQLSALYNITFASRTWGAIAIAFLGAVQEGGEANLKAFTTEYLGKPFARYEIKDENLEAVKKLKRGYRRISWQGQPLMQVPLPTEEIRFLGMTADVQRGEGNDYGVIGAVKWLIFAAGWDGQIWVLDWGAVPDLESLPEVVEDRSFCSKDDPDPWMTVDVVCVDTGYLGERVRAFLAGEGGSGSNVPRWCGVRGRSKENESALRGRARLKKEYPARDKHGRDTVLRIINIKSDHWEFELHVERIAKEGDGTRSRPAVNLPSDTPDGFLVELTNMTQFRAKPNAGNVREIKWRKRNSDQPNDISDLVKYALVVTDAVQEREDQV